MTTQELIDKLNLKPVSDFDSRDIDGVFISDMVSDVMANAQSGNLWLTVQTHKSIISAANLVDVSAIIICNGKKIPEETTQLASKYKIAVLSTDLSIYQLAGKLIELGIR